MSTPAATSVASWLESAHRQRVLLLGGVGVAAVLLLQFHRWLAERRHGSRRGRLKRGSLDDTASSGSGSGRTQRGERHSATTATRHSADVAATATPGREGSSLYPFEPLDERSLAASPLSALASAASYSAPDAVPGDSSPPQSSSSSARSSSLTAPSHSRDPSVSNDVPREQMFYGLLNIIATVPTPHEASIASAHIHRPVETQPALSSSSAPTSTVASPRRGTALFPPSNYHRSSHSSDSLQPQHHSSSSLSLPPPVLSAATDKSLIQALHAKWQRQQRRRVKRQRRAARLAGLLDDASTASPSNSSVSSASALGDDAVDDDMADMADSVDHCVDFEYESGEEASNSYKGGDEEVKHQPAKQPSVLVSSIASTAASSSSSSPSTSSPTHSAIRSPSVSPLTFPTVPRSPHRLNGPHKPQGTRLDFHSQLAQREVRQRAADDHTESKRQGEGRTTQPKDRWEPVDEVARAPVRQSSGQRAAHSPLLTLPTG